MTAYRQVAALPMRRSKSGAVEILLVTSRDTGRWIIPKGWPSKRGKDHKAAAREARQEAGVAGKIMPTAFGSYRYVKPELGDTSIDVTVFLLSVRKQSKRWPEKNERRRAWFHVLDAAGKITEPELSSLICSLQVPSKPVETERKPRSYPGEPLNLPVLLPLLEARFAQV
ncbi:MAG: NUDIX hydrolase [Rhodomicrobium sp.]